MAFRKAAIRRPGYRQRSPSQTRDPFDTYDVAHAHAVIALGHANSQVVPTAAGGGACR